MPSLLMDYAPERLHLDHRASLGVRFSARHAKDQRTKAQCGYHPNLRPGVIPRSAMGLTGGRARADRGVLRATTRVRGTPAPVRRRYLARAAHAAHLGAWVRRAVPSRRRRRSGRARERHEPDRADPSRSRESGGSGFGLSIVAALAESHGGSASYTRAPGGGARFEVRIPRDAGWASTPDGGALKSTVLSTPASIRSSR
jgi:hypothetical protein